MLVLSDGCSASPRSCRAEPGQPRARSCACPAHPSPGLRGGTVIAYRSSKGPADGHFQPALPGGCTHPQHPAQPEVCSQAPFSIFKREPKFLNH